MDIILFLFSCSHLRVMQCFVRILKKRKPLSFCDDHMIGQFSSVELSISVQLQYHWAQICLLIILFLLLLPYTFVEISVYIKNKISTRRRLSPRPPSFQTIQNHHTVLFVVSFGCDSFENW